MPVRSAGLLLFRQHPGPEVFLVHPGGPFWARKDEAAWSIPKGLLEPDEDALAAARREFEEETGFPVTGPCFELGIFRQPGGKLVVAWASEGDCDPAELRSNSFTMEWPPRSGRLAAFPEIDRGGWFEPGEAETKLLKGQRPILHSLLQRLAQG